MRIPIQGTYHDGVLLWLRQGEVLVPQLDVALVLAPQQPQRHAHDQVRAKHVHPAKWPRHIRRKHTQQEATSETSSNRRAPYREGWHNRKKARRGGTHRKTRELTGGSTPASVEGMGPRFMVVKRDPQGRLEAVAACPLMFTGSTAATDSIGKNTHHQLTGRRDCAQWKWKGSLMGM